MEIFVVYSWNPAGDRSAAGPAPVLPTQQQCRLFLGPRGLHGHAGANHGRVTPVPSHSIQPKGGPRPAQSPQRPQQGAGARCPASGHAQPLHLVQQVEVVDGHADVRLALAVPRSLPASRPRHLLQDGARRLGRQEVVVRWALEVEAFRGRGGRGAGPRWGVWRGGGS